MTDVYLGSYGQEIEVSVTLDGVPLELAGTASEFTFISPNGDRTPKPAEKGTGIASYVIEEGLLSEAGIWNAILSITTDDALYFFPFWFEVQSLP